MNRQELLYTKFFLPKYIIVDYYWSKEQWKINIAYATQKRRFFEKPKIVSWLLYNSKTSRVSGDILELPHYNLNHPIVVLKCFQSTRRKKPNFSYIAVVIEILL